MPNSCYVFTDSGTYDYLASGTDPAGTIPALKVVPSDNSASAPGGAFELINYFHGYIINPSKPGQTVNLTAAQDFLNYITSPAVQAQVATYLEAAGVAVQADGVAAADQFQIPATFVARAGKKLTVTGTLANAQPGYPVLSGEPVAISKVVNGLPVSVATAKTDSQGKYSISLVPPTNGSYRSRPIRSQGRGADSESGVRRSALTGVDDGGEGHGSQRHHRADLTDSGRAGVDLRTGVTRAPATSRRR